MTAPCHHGGPDPATCAWLTFLLTPDGQSGLRVEELHVLDVDGEGHPIAWLDRGLGLNAGHALAGPHGRCLVLIEGTFSDDPVRVDGEVDYQFRAERLDQLHVTG